MISPTQRTEWRKIAEAATPGPWELQDGSSWRRIGTREHDGNVLCPTNHPVDRHPDLQAGRGEDTYANLRHITTFDPPTIISLLDALDERERQIEAAHNSAADLLARIRAGDLDPRPAAEALGLGFDQDALTAILDAAAENAALIAENTKLGAELNAAYRLASLTSSADEVQALAEAVKERDDMAANAADWCDRADEAYGRIEALSALLRKAGKMIADAPVLFAHGAGAMTDNGDGANQDRNIDDARALIRRAASLAQEIREALGELAERDG